MAKQQSEPSLFDVIDEAERAIQPSQLLTPEEIFDEAGQSLIQAIRESKRIERKSASIHQQELGEYFSMWSNTKPHGGLIAIGVRDDGAIEGCTRLSQNQLNTIEQTARDRCPDAKFEIKQVPAKDEYGNDNFIILIHVKWHPSKLVRTTKNVAFIRLGDSKHRLTDIEAREIEAEKGQVDVELEPCALIYPDDFDLQSLEKFVENVAAKRVMGTGHSNEDVLQLRRLGKLDNKGQFVPNIACVLLFAKDPCRVIPGCKIHFLRFEGESEGTGEKYNPIKDLVLEGTVPELIKKAQDMIMSQLRDFTRLGTDGKFFTAPEYPQFAWYEAVVNACVHRSYNLKTMTIFVKMYDDKILIESPGGFPPFVTPETIYDQHQPRNPNLMDALYYMEFVRCAHEGTKRIREEMLRLGLPAPEFAQKELEYTQVRVTLRNNISQRKVWVDAHATKLIGEVVFKALNEHEKQVINLLVEKHAINVSDTQRLTGRSWPSAKKLLDGLVGKKILDHVKRLDIDRDPQAYYVLRVPKQKT